MAKRIFFNWDRPFLWQVEDYLFDHIFNNLEYESKSIHLCLPTQRSARRLTELISLRADQSNLPLRDYEVETLSGLQSLFRDKSSKLISWDESIILWDQAIKKYLEEKSEFSKLTALSNDTPAFYLEQLRNTLSSIGKSPSEVIEIIHKEYVGVETEIWVEISQVWQIYEQYLEANSIVDSYSPCFSSFTQSISIERDHLFLLIGCDQIPQSIQLDLHNNTCELISLIPASEFHASGFTEIGTLIPDYWLSKAPVIKEESLEFCNTDSELLIKLKYYLDELKTQNYPDSMISIVALDPTMLGPLQTTIQSAGHKAVLPGTKNIKNTSLGVLLLDIVNAFILGEEAWAKIAKHPLILVHLKTVLGLEDENTILNDLDLIKLKTAAASLDTTEIIPIACRVRLERIKKALADLGLVRAPSSISKENFKTKISSILSILLKPSDHRSINLSLEELRKLEECFDELSPNQLEENKEYPLSLLHSIFKEILYRKDLVGENTKGIEVLGLQESNLDDSQVCFFLSVTDEFYPPRIPTDPLLPNSLRTRLGLADEQTKEAQSVLYLNSITNSKQMIKFFAPLIKFSGDTCRLSKLIILGDEENISKNLKKFYLQDQKTSYPSHSKQEIRNLIEDNLDKKCFPIKALSASKIKSYLECPYTFYVKYILKADDINYDPDQLPPLEIGSLLHSLFEDFSSSNLTLLKSRKETEAYFKEYCSKRYGSNLDLTVQVQLEIILKKFLCFCDWHLKNKEEGWKVIASEHQFSDNTSIQLSNNETIQFLGKIDRIDYHPLQKSLRYIDFKTGDSAHRFNKVKTREAWLDPQLPLYAKLSLNELIANHNLPPETNVELLYVSFPKEGNFDEDSLEYTMDLGNEVLSLAKEVSELILNQEFWPPKKSSEITNRIFGSATKIGAGQMPELEDD